MNLFTLENQTLYSDNIISFSLNEYIVHRLSSLNESTILKLSENIYTLLGFSLNAVRLTWSVLIAEQN